MREQSDRFTTIDLFAGAGGLALGFEGAGFTTLAANDLEPNAAHTFRENFPQAAFIESPIQDLTGTELMKAAGLKRGALDVLLGGPPCQAFSVYNHQRGFQDERAGLFREYLRLVEELSPRVLVIENVTGMASLGGGSAVAEIRDRLGELGYWVSHRVLRAEAYGVPQERRRLFFLGSRVGPLEWPTATHGPSTELLGSQLARFVTVNDAISDLPALALGEGHDIVVPYGSRPSSDFQRRMRLRSLGVSCHFAPKLGDINARRIPLIPQGGSWRDLPLRLLPEGMKRAKRSDHTKRYGRLHPDGLFSTILTKADLHWGAFIHPTQDRTLTVRECARAQSIPDWFVPSGSRVEQYRQIGNAVPPLLAQAIAQEIRTQLTRTQRTKKMRGLRVAVRV